MRNLIKKLVSPFLKIGVAYYFKKDRKYTYKDIQVLVKPEVFPPHYTISTKIILDYISNLDLNQKEVLELGCGSGIISLFSSSKGANVLATDINKIALEALKIAAIKNNLKITALYSNLFDSIKQTNFNYILINPPYYPSTPKNIKEHAWFCGENFEYFEKLFLQLPKYLATNTLIILSEDCDIIKIKEIALKNNLILNHIFEKKVTAEKNYLFNIKKL